MPIYEYQCLNCGEKYAELVGVTQDERVFACPKCRSEQVRRLVSRVSRVRSEDERLDAFGDRLEQMGEPESYREVREAARELGHAMDDDAADEMEELMEEGDED